MVVGTLLIYAFVKFRQTRSNSDREPAQVYGSNQIETAWTVIPILIVVVLFLASAREIHSVQDAARPAGAVQVTVIGHQFWWEFRYPGFGIVTANELSCSSQQSDTSPAHILEVDVRRHGSQLLDSTTCRKDGLDPESYKRDVDRAARNRRVSRPVRAILRHAAREDAFAWPSRIGSRCDFGAWVQAQKDSLRIKMKSEAAGRHVFETTACLNCSNT